MIRPEVIDLVGVGPASLDRYLYLRRSRTNARLEGLAIRNLFLPRHNTGLNTVHLSLNIGQQRGHRANREIHVRRLIIASKSRTSHDHLLPVFYVLCMSRLCHNKDFLLLSLEIHTK